MTLEELKDKKILLLGYAVEGKATAAFLTRMLPSVEFGVADAKDGSDYLDRQKEYDLVIKTAGMPRRLVTRPYTTAANIFFANTKGTVIGVTGSKGKSTTASLIYQVLKSAGKKAELVGNIGLPMLDFLRGQDDADVVYVAELSSYMCEDLRYSPRISVFLNFFPDHMDYHGGLEAYWRAKANIVAHATARDYFIFNPAYPRIVELARNAKARAVPFVDTLPFSTEGMPLIGAHNVDNMRAALTAARALRVGDDVCEKVFRTFAPLPHRLQNIGTFRGVTFYDDAISTTPESTIAALRALPNVATIFLGGTDRGYEFSALADEVLGRGIGAVVLFPESGVKIRAALEAVATKRGTPMPRVLETRDMKEAVAFAYEHTPSGKSCLLSCASPSYSLWKNFEEKGDVFAREVKAGA